MFFFNNATHCGRKRFFFLWRLFFFFFFSGLFLRFGFFFFFPWFLGFLFLSRRLLVIDYGHDFAYPYFLTFASFCLQQTSFFRDDFRRNFVGLKSEECIAGVYEVAGFFMPDRYDTAGDRFADRGNFDFDRHASEKRRGLTAFRQYKTSATYDP